MARNRRGHLELIRGPMFAGKTTALLERLARADATGCSVVALKPQRDTRSGSATLRSHTGATWPAIAVGTAGEIHPAAGVAEMVVIDEAHFFDHDLADACAKLIGAGLSVVAAGVDWDHRGVLFDSMARLIEIADTVTRLTTGCARCGAPAEFTQRLVADNARIVVGGAEAYEPRCAACFKSPVR
jgi:thymidine kinase